jgi:phosphopantetheinyl transferase (holo-ACP synthase)
MYYVDIDIVAIMRIDEAINRWREHFSKRLYTEGELGLCQNPGKSS